MSRKVHSLFNGDDQNLLGERELLVGGETI